MITNADITIFNKRHDQEDRTEYFVPTVIKGVNLFYRKTSSSSTGNQEKGMNAVIRIPLKAKIQKKYAEAAAYRAMENVDGAWTVQIGDFVVPKIVSTVEPVTDAEIARDYHDIITVAQFTDNTSKGSRYVRHWRIGGM